MDQTTKPLGQRMLDLLGIQGNAVTELELRITAGNPPVLKVTQVVTRRMGELIAAELQQQSYELQPTGETRVVNLPASVDDVRDL
jgi:hypothetical protein